MNILSIVLAAKLAYKSEHKIKMVYPDCEFIDIDNTQLFIDENDERILISFRGTELEDITTNLEFTKIMDIHRGFYNALGEVWDLIQSYITNDKPFYITGHSLGAALASLCAYRLSLNDIDDINVFAFGQPRAGGSEFAKQYNEALKNKTYRFVNNNDIVTRIPPRIAGYTHVGTLQYFKENGELTGDISQWDRFLDRLNGRIQDIGEWGTDGFKDHSINEYVKLIRNYDERINKR